MAVELYTPEDPEWKSRKIKTLQADLELRHAELAAQNETLRKTIRELEQSRQRLEAQNTTLRVTQEALHTAQETLRHSQATLQAEHERLTRFQEKLQQSETELHDLYENAPIGYLALDRNGTILRLNREASRLLGATPRTLLHQPLSRFISEENHDKFSDHLSTCARSPGVTSTELGLHVNPPCYVRLSSVLEKSTESDDYIYKTILADITERRIAEEDIRKLNEDLEVHIRQRTEQLERVNRELESFSYSVSHDLKTPLRAIAGFARLLSDSSREEGHGLSEKQQDYLSLIREGVEQMKALIESLLTFARITSQVPQPVTVDMRALVEEVIRTFEHVLGELRARDKVHLGDLPPLPAGDPVLLRQVLINLLSNAFKFTRTVADPRVEVAGYRQDNELVYYVRDNGIGFTAAHASKLFQVFQRLHSPAEFEGSGVGLANVRRIIERHGGRVWAEGEEGKGATFYFALPNHPA